MVEVGRGTGKLRMESGLEAPGASSAFLHTVFPKLEQQRTDLVPPAGLGDYLQLIPFTSMQTSLRLVSRRSVFPFCVLAGARESNSMNVFSFKVVHPTSFTLAFLQPIGRDGRQVFRRFKVTLRESLEACCGDGNEIQ